MKQKNPRKKGYKRENVWWGYLISAGKKGHLLTEAQKRKVSVGLRRAYAEGRVPDKTGFRWTDNQKAKLKNRIPWNKGKKHLGGDKHWNWKGGINPLHDTIRKSLKYKAWRGLVFERDGYTCQECRAHSGNGTALILHADHIKPFALYPDLRFVLENGRTLCAACHRLTPTYGTRTRTSATIS